MKQTNRFIAILLASLVLSTAGRAMAEQSLFEQAEQGVAEAQYKVARLYLYGFGGIEQNSDEAIKWYTKAAEQNFAPAQSRLGIIYKIGAWTEPDYEEAVKWYTKAAEQDVAEAQHSLWIMYSLGLGVDKDIEIAQKYLAQSRQN